jgi:Flp pilus assembly CpaE family ATPase
VPDGLDLSLFDDELSQEPAVLEAAAELAELAGELVESAGEAEAAALEADTSPAAAATAEPQAEASASSQQAAASVASGSEPQPKKALDATRPRGKKKSSGRSGAGSEESLNRLAGQLQDRDSKLRAMGPGSEARRESKSKLVCFLPVQGGNGSSTVSLHVAEAISHHLNKRVLLTDFDFHSGTLAFRLGLKPEHTFVDVFKWEQPENGSWDSVVCPWKQLDVLVAPPSNTSIHPQSMDRLPDILMSALRRYPYVIVDHPDAIYSSSRHILAMSDLVYLVCTPEITSLHLARRKVQQIRAMGVPGERLRLIVNRTGSWGSLGLEDVGKIAGVPVSWALMNDYAALRDAVWNGGLVQQGSALARQLRELGWSIMGVDAQVAEESAAPVDVASRV